MRHVFTYGSLMFARVWSGIVRGRYPAAAAALPGFVRQRVRGQDYPSLDRQASRAAEGVSPVVEGVLYFGVHDSDLSLLDAFEGSDYRRITVEVVLQEPLPAGQADGHAAGPALGSGIGSALAADTYLFIAREKVEPGPWDPQRFERERMDRFLRDFPPPPDRGGTAPG